MPDTGFPPILPRAPRLLILGSMPGQASLAARQYYAHPRNAFWWILSRLLGEAAVPSSYAARCRLLKRHGIALWDVYAACERAGSLDSAIVVGSETLNDIPALLKKHRTIRAVATNGGTARRVFCRYWKDVAATAGVRVLHLPSTSPANARMSAESKLSAWRELAAFMA